jgi:hypothetical protein
MTIAQLDRDFAAQHAAAAAFVVSAHGTLRAGAAQSENEKAGRPFSNRSYWWDTAITAIFKFATLMQQLNGLVLDVMLEAKPRRLALLRLRAYFVRCAPDVAAGFRIWSYREFSSGGAKTSGRAAAHEWRADIWRMTATQTYSVLKEAANEWIEDKATTLGAALAYYTVFSLAPLLVISIAIAGLVFGHEAAQGQILDQLRGLLGEQSGKAIQEMVQKTSAQPSTGAVATVVGVITLLIGASSVFGQLQTSLNAVWWVEPKPGRWVMGIIKDRILSFGFILVVGFLLLVSLILSAGLAAIGKWFGGMTSLMRAQQESCSGDQVHVR